MLAQLSDMGTDVRYVLSDLQRKSSYVDFFNSALQYPSNSWSIEMIGQIWHHCIRHWNHGCVIAVLLYGNHR